MEIAAFGVGQLRVTSALYEARAWALEARRVAEAEGFQGCVRSHEMFDAVAAQHLAVRVSPLDLSVRVRKQGRIEDAEGYLGRALGILEACLRGHDNRPSIARSPSELTACARDPGRVGGKEELLTRALNILTTAPSGNDERLTETLHALGAFTQQAGKLEGAQTASRFPDRVCRVPKLEEAGAIVRAAWRPDETARLFELASIGHHSCREWAEHSSRSGGLHHPKIVCAGGWRATRRGGRILRAGCENPNGKIGGQNTLSSQGRRCRWGGECGRPGE